MQVTADNTVLSGHRRLQAATKVGLVTVPVNVVNAEDTLKQEEHILEYNRYRQKNNEQCVREYIAYKRIETTRAKRRGGQRTDLEKIFTPGESAGKARDIAAGKEGWSGVTAERGEAVVQLIDKAKKSGKLDRAKQLREILNKRTINTAFKKAQLLGLIPLEKSSGAPKKKRSPNSNAGTVTPTPRTQSPDGVADTEPQVHGNHAEPPAPASPAPTEAAHQEAPAAYESNPFGDDAQTPTAAAEMVVGTEAPSDADQAEFVLADGDPVRVAYINTRTLPSEAIQEQLEKINRENPYPDEGGFQLDMPDLVLYQILVIKAAMFVISELDNVPVDTGVAIMSNALTIVRNTMDRIHQNK